jgi:hypothetical protein
VVCSTPANGRICDTRQHQAIDRGFEAVPDIVEAPCQGLQFLTSRGQCRFPPVPLKDRKPRGVSHLTNLNRNGRLGQVKFLGRPGETAQARNGHKYLQLPKGDATPVCALVKTNAHIEYV